MIDKDNIPEHVAIIMDGNGRWAKERGLSRIDGHREGIKRVKELLKSASELGIKFLTLFAFSTENWKRPKLEVSMLMHSLDNFLSRNIKTLVKDNIRLLVIGSKKSIPEYLGKRLIDARKQTKEGSGLTVILAFNYGGRAEIVDAAKMAAKEILAGRMRPEDLSEENFELFLYTAGLPDPGLLIRTSGELRISNFLLWQLSYAELYFTSTYWPDFKREDLEKAITSYQGRSRRFGGIAS